MSKTNVEGSVTINASPEKILEVLEDIEHAPEWVPSLHTVKDIKGKGAGCTYTWMYKIGPANIEGKVEITESSIEQFVMKTEGSVKSYWTWEMGRKGKTATILRLSISYDLPGNILAQVADKLVIEKQNKKELEQALTNLKERLEK
ncbi:MAG: hypothetical protein B6242_05650 [Anaerolineaceae bacterium 4572_78]|nr:MAG: hypothetical protein B6242_05650 [Anaerolineaceae bacterium 4572_78]